MNQYEWWERERGEELAESEAAAMYEAQPRSWFDCFKAWVEYLFSEDEF